MRTTRPLWLVLLVLSLVLAGCASPDDDVGASDDGDIVGEDGAPPGDPGEDVQGERWHAFAFDDEVTPRSGGSGRISSFTFEMTQEEDGAATTLNVVVDVSEGRMMDARIKRSAFDADGTTTEETRSTSVEVIELKHTVTVVKDDTGEQNAGDVSTVHAYLPTSETEASATWLWDFVAMSWTDADGATGRWEYYKTPEMEAESEAASESGGFVMFLPYDEGDTDFSGHWGYQIFGMAYDPVWLAGWDDGTQEFEEGSWSFGGYSYETTRETLEVGGYTFDGWRVEWSAAADGETATYRFEVAPELPLPVSYRFGGSGSGDSSHWTYALKDLELA